MPLIQSGSQLALHQNLRELSKSGKRSPAQNFAIATRVMRANGGRLPRPKRKGHPLSRVPPKMKKLRSIR